MIDLIVISGAVVITAAVLLLSRKLNLTWADTPSPPITPTPNAVPDKGDNSLKDLRAQLPECPLEYQVPHIPGSHTALVIEIHAAEIQLAGKDDPLDARGPHQ